MDPNGAKKKGRRAEAAAMKFHPLFYPADNHTTEEQQEYTEDKIFEIMIGRYDTDGKFRCALRRYQPSELRDLRAVHEAHGGGVYDLMAMNAENRMVRKTRWTIEGVPRSLNGVDATPAQQQTPQGVTGQVPGAPAVTGTDPMSAVIGLMGTIVVASMQQTGAIIAAMASNKQAPVDPSASLAPVLEALSRFMPQPQAPVIMQQPAPPAQSPIQMMREIHAFQKEIASPETKEESTAEIVQAVMPAVGQVVAQILSGGGAPMQLPHPAG